MLCSCCFQTISKTKSHWMARWCHSCTPCCLRQVLNPRVSAAMEMAISGETLRPVTSQAGLTLSDTTAQKSKERGVRYTTMQCGHVFWLRNLVVVINLLCWWQAKAYQNEHAQTSRQTDRQTGRQPASQSANKPDRQAERQTHRHTDTHIQNNSSGKTRLVYADVHVGSGQYVCFWTRGGHKDVQW